MTKLRGLLVGMHFHPPAKLLLSALPVGSALRLIPEPENPWDELAIIVEVASSSLPSSMDSYLEQALPDTGFSLEEVRGKDWWMLGHLAATGGKPLSKVPGLQGNSEFHPLLASGLREARLEFDGAGNPIVTAASPAALPAGGENE